MSNFNKVILIGRLTRTPELRNTPNGKAVTDISLAINENYKDKDETTFVDVTLWGKTAELAAQYVKKGEPLLVEGKLQLDKWQDKQSGQNRQKLKVVGFSITFLGGGNGEGQNQSETPRQSTDERNFNQNTESDHFA